MPDSEHNVNSFGTFLEELNVPCSRCDAHGFYLSDGPGDPCPRCEKCGGSGDAGRLWLDGPHWEWDENIRNWVGIFNIVRNGEILGTEGFSATLLRPRTEP